MYTLSVQNKYGEQLELTNNESYVISEIDGLDPPEAVINSTRNVNADGSIFNNSYLTNRQIIITLAINQPAETNRINLYKYIKNKYPIRIYYENDTRKVYIDGYVKNFEINFFGIKQIAQITIICVNPYFLADSENETELSEVEALFEFPFETPEPIPFSEVGEDVQFVVMNNGDVETGAVFEIHVQGGSVTNPMIYNVETNEFIGFNMTLNAGDSLVINTKTKEKSAMYYPVNAAGQSALGHMMFNSTWLQLVSGANYFGISANSNTDRITVTVTSTDKFEGV